MGKTLCGKIIPSKRQNLNEMRKDNDNIGSLSFFIGEQSLYLMSKSDIKK